jgi:hypothetical protein
VLQDPTAEGHRRGHSTKPGQSHTVSR